MSKGSSVSRGNSSQHSAISSVSIAGNKRGSRGSKVGTEVDSKVHLSLSFIRQGHEGGWKEGRCSWASLIISYWLIQANFAPMLISTVFSNACLVLYVGLTFVEPESIYMCCIR